MSTVESQPEALERKPAPLREQREATLIGLEYRDAGATGDGSMTLMGHATVFEKLSLPLYDWQYGEFQERVARGAFEDVLSRNPDVHLVYGHDMNAVLARTQSKTLELREDPAGLRVFARLDPSDSDVQRLAPKMARGDVNQMSYAFTVARDEWLIENPDTPDERVIRTINQIGELYDVSVVAQGAFPQTDANLRSLLEAAAQSGRVAVRATDLPHRSAPKAEGEQENSRDGSPPAGIDLRKHRLTVMRNRLALLNQNQEK